MSIVTNDLKKGDIVLMRNGTRATLKDSKKGNIRMCEVNGEWGSVYAHDMTYKVDGEFNHTKITHTPAQLELQKMTAALGF